jgi:hypothetical protein
MSDDGGSTGKLRDECGVLPPGDIRQCLVALSELPDVRDMFSHRMSGGSFEGHAVGNIILSGLDTVTVGGDFLSDHIQPQNNRDALLRRTYIRHDAKKVSEAILGILLQQPEQKAS